MVSGSLVVMNTHANYSIFSITSIADVWSRVKESYGVRHQSGDWPRSVRGLPAAPKTVMPFVA